jgi:4-amino-4-deoxy-L-arabinose transferase-like glycosyltransferase
MSTTSLPLHAGAERSAGAGARLRALVRGRASDPAWIRPALFGVVLLAAALCLWDLTSSGYSNTYYASAVKAASESWKAWFFGSLDPGSFITVDKPPLSLWLMGLSARVLGFSSLSLLLPQALCTIAAVALLYATVRRAFGPTAGVIAAALLAITPVTVAIGRVDNPDALLVLLMVASAWALVRALEAGRTRFLLLAGLFVGLAFMTKMLQGWMIVPALALAYLVAAPVGAARRVWQLALAGVAMVIASAAWPLAVSLWPGSTPYIGGSTDGTVWDLILGYNGFGRIFGESGGMGGGQGASFGGAAGVWRMFNEQVGGQVAWLLPLAAAGLVAGLWLSRRGTRMARAGWALFGAWAVVHVVVFSFQQGIFHPYYVSALAPAVAALSGGGVVALWSWARASWAGVAVLVAAIVSTGWVAVALLARTADFAPWLSVAIPVAAAVAVFGAVALRVPALLPRRAIAIGAVALAFAVAAGPASYSLATAGRALNGNNVSAGPATTSQTGGPMGGGGGAPGGGEGGVSSETIAYLEAHQGSAKYLVAASGSQTTAGIIIATGKPVVTIGGFNGGDAAPTVDQLAQMVADGQLKYVLVSDGGGFGGRGGSSELTSWVKAHGTAVDGAGTSNGTLYLVEA